MLDFIEKNKKKLAKIFVKNSVEFAYLFGSFAYQNLTPESDVDVGVYLNEKKAEKFFETRLNLISEISKILKKEADIIILNTASPFLKYVVLQEGKLIYEKNKSKRIDFELKATNEYFDYAPILKLYNQRILNK